MRKIILVFVTFSLMIGIMNGLNMKEINRGYKFYAEGAKKKDKEKVNKSIAVFKKLEKDKPKNAFYKVLLGNCLFLKARDAFFLSKMSWVNRGKKKHDEAVKISPDNIWVRIERGIMSMNLPDFLNRFEIAKKDFEYLTKKIEKLSPEDLIEIEGYKLYKKDDESIKQFYQKTKQKIYYYASKVRLKEENSEDAKKYLTKAISINYNSYWKEKADKKLEELN
jgi:hypothetical protein